MASKEQTKNWTEDSYPFLTQSEIDDCEGDVESLNTYNRLNKKKITNRLKNFYLSKERSGVDLAALEGGKDELRVVVLGKTGQGKSATANTLLGQVYRKGDAGATGGVPICFPEDFTAQSVTKVSRCITKKVDGRKISIIDTPGLQDTTQTDETILKEIGRIMTIHDKGIHAFIYVMNMADPRFTTEDRKVLELLQVAFGGDFKKYCLLLFSHGDASLKAITLDDYRHKQLNVPGVPSILEGSPSELPDAQHSDKDFAVFLKEMSWRIFAVDNKAGTSFENHFFRETSFKIVDKMRFDNHPESYTNIMFDKAQKEKEERHQIGLRKGWDPKVMSIVDEIIDFKPEVTKEELNKLVKERLEHDRQEKVKELKRLEAQMEERMKQEEERIEALRKKEEERREALERQMREQLEEGKRVFEQQMEQKQREWEAEKEEREEKQRKHDEERSQEQQAEMEKALEKMNLHHEQKRDEEKLERLKAEQAERARQEEEERKLKAKREEEEIEIKAKKEALENQEKERLAKEKEELQALKRKIDEDTERLNNGNLTRNVNDQNAQRREMVESSAEYVVSAVKSVAVAGYAWIKSLFD